jgi:phospholipid/cholesterol/gamma-HCH transport system substrate-binding protein
MENKSHALAAGGFVLLLSTALVSMAVWLTRDDRALISYELAGAVNVSGLQPQANVRFQGVPVGKVTSIKLDPSTRGLVVVNITVDEHAPISNRTFATLAYQGVTGLTFIQLDDAAPAAGRRVGSNPA